MTDALSYVARLEFMVASPASQQHTQLQVGLVSVGLFSAGCGHGYSKEWDKSQLGVGHLGLLPASSGSG